MSSPAYGLIAIDLDGTLLCSKGEVSKANLRAIRSARDAGVRVTVCTGRSIVECKYITDQLEQEDPVVVAGGALLSCPRTMETIHRFTMSPSLVREIADVIVSHGHAALLLKDACATGGTGDAPARSRVAEPSQASGTSITTPAASAATRPGFMARGHDYLVVSPRGVEGIDPVTRWWFDMLSVPVRVVPRIEEDDHPLDTLRIGLCGTRKSTREVAREIKRTFGDRVTLHDFHAVVPGSNPDDTDDHILIIEAFDALVNKWTAISWLANRDSISHNHIAVIGNDVNDIAMLKAAGLGIAMGNAIEEARLAAHRHTLGNDADGVAHAIERILAGEW